MYLVTLNSICFVVKASLTIRFSSICGHKSYFILLKSSIWIQHNFGGLAVVTISPSPCLHSHWPSPGASCPMAASGRNPPHHSKFWNTKYRKRQADSLGCTALYCPVGARLCDSDDFRGSNNVWLSHRSQFGTFYDRFLLQCGPHFLVIHISRLRSNMLMSTYVSDYLCAHMRNCKYEHKCKRSYECSYEKLQIWA